MATGDYSKKIERGKVVSTDIYERVCRISYCAHARAMLKWQDKKVKEGIMAKKTILQQQNIAYKKPILARRMMMR